MTEFQPGSEVLGTAQMAEADRRTIVAGTTGITLMERAGRAVAEQVRSIWPDGPVDVLCGPGNNGGDGYVAAQMLAGWGRKVRVFSMVPVSALSGDARLAGDAWNGNVEPLESFEPRDGGVVVDALFGAGLSRPLEGKAAEIAGRSPDFPVLSVDVPSGLDGNTGLATGATFAADATVTFARLKPAHLLFPGRGYCGQIYLEDIGIPDRVIEELECSVHHNSPQLWSELLPWPRIDGHKHQRGRVSVVSGPMSATGAARLSAMAALRSGAGLVTLRCHPSSLMVNAVACLAVMTTAHEDTASMVEACGRDSVVVVGPASGVTDRTRDVVKGLLRTPAKIVVDADAITVFQDDPASLFSLLRSDDILTPHMGEFSRLFPDLDASSLGKLEAVRQAAARADCVVLLKGPDTVIAAPDGTALINSHSTPFLATAGSGDVLAGMIAGWMAQGMDTLNAAGAAVWMHGEAGRRIGPGLIAEDLPSLLPSVLSDLFAV